MQENKKEKSWDFFCSYYPGKNNQNVIEIRNHLLKTFNITSWIDVLEMKSGDRAKKIYEGISNSSLFLCFVTPEYSDNKDCINELCLAKKLGKELIFFINEDATGMNQEMLTRNILKEVSFYMGDAIYYRKREELYEAVQKALDKKSKSIITDRKVSVFISHDKSSIDKVNALVRTLKPLLDVDFETKNHDAIESCDAFIACVNSNYLNNDDLKDAYNNAVASGKTIIKINLEKDFYLNEEPNEKISSFNLYNDTNMLYMNGRGSVFIELVYFLEKKLPKSLFQAEKNTDVLIIASESIAEEFSKLNLWTNVKYSIPNTSFDANLLQVKDSKVVIAVINDELNKCRSSIEELKFAQMLRNQIITIEDTETERLNIDIKEILKFVPSESQYQGIENLSNKKFTKQLVSHVKNAIMRSKLEKDVVATIIEVKNDKLLEEEENRKKVLKFKKNVVSFRTLFITLGLLLLIGYLVAVSIGGVAISKVYIEEVTTTKAADLSNTTKTNSQPKKNNCLKKESSPKFRKQEYVPFSLYKVHFKGKILDLIEICVPSSSFVVNLGDRLVMFDKNGVILNGTDLTMYLNKDKTRMVATENEIVIFDGSDFLYLFSFDLEYREAKSINNDISPKNFLSLSYFNDSLYLYEITEGVIKFNINDETKEILNIKNIVNNTLDSNVKLLFQVYKDYIFLITNTKLFKYSKKDKNMTSETILCYNDDESTVELNGFFADSDNFLYWTCSDTNDFNYDFSFFSTYFTDCIYVSQVGALEDPYNIIYYYDGEKIIRSLLDSDNRLVLAIYDGQNSAVDFLE